MAQYIDLDADETQRIYNVIQSSKLKPVDIEYKSKCSNLSFMVENQKYVLVYDRECDWFLDIAYLVKE
jgi:hypothetical protein